MYTIVCLCTINHFAFLFCILDAHRALELLEDYHSRLSQPHDTQLKVAIEKVIRIFKSRLFQALLGKHCKLIKLSTLSNMHIFIQHLYI